MSVPLEAHLQRVRARLRSGATPTHRRLGQHLILDPGLLRRIVALAGPLEGRAVVEVGAGPGTLTAALLEAGARATLVEVDPRWARFLRDCFGDEVTVHERDAMDAGGAFLRALLDPVAVGGPPCLIANLPYQVASPILVEAARVLRPPSVAVVTIQREVARRLCAPPGSGDRGLLTLLVGRRVRVRRCLDLAPGAFIPPPKVTSCVVELLPRDQEVDQPWETLEELWRVAFQGRRKMLRSALRRSHPALVARSELADLLEKRAEDLNDEQWDRLARCEVAARTGPGG